jgi:hypothetical protein
MAPAPTCLANVQTILIVEDDPSLLESLSEALSEKRDLRCLPIPFEFVSPRAPTC